MKCVNFLLASKFVININRHHHSFLLTKLHFYPFWKTSKKNLFLTRQPGIPNSPGINKYYFPRAWKESVFQKRIKHSRTSPDKPGELTKLAKRFLTSKSTKGGHYYWVIPAKLSCYQSRINLSRRWPLPDFLRFCNWYDVWGSRPYLYSWTPRCFFLLSGRYANTLDEVMHNSWQPAFLSQTKVLLAAKNVHVVPNGFISSCLLVA